MVAGAGSPSHWPYLGQLLQLPTRKAPGCPGLQAPPSWPRLLGGPPAGPAPAATARVAGLCVKALGRGCGTLPGRRSRALSERRRRGSPAVPEMLSASANMAAALRAAGAQLREPRKLGCVCVREREERPGGRGFKSQGPAGGARAVADLMINWKVSEGPNT